MKLVRFTTDMAPHKAGETRLVPDALAEALEAAGSIEPNPPAHPPMQQDPAEPRRKRGGYPTKGLL